MCEELPHVDLFSGIGGFGLAWRWCGGKTVQFVEIDPFCHKVLNKNFPGVPIHNDIKTFKYSGARPFILTGGFPCQPFSCAGKRRGKEDDRFLWPEMLRVVSETKPYWVVAENVAGFIDMGLDDCISDLENQGYEVQTFIIPACAVNAPHRRDRVWIVAHNNGTGNGTSTSGTNVNGTQDSEEQQLSQSEHSRQDCHAADTESQQAHTAEPRGLHAEFSGTDSDVTDTGHKGLQRSERTGTHDKGQAAHGSIAECNHAWNEPWIEAATRLCGVDARVPNRVDRLKSLGNAIVPQVAYQIMKAILEVSNAK